MPAPSLIGEHGLNVPKGWWDMAALDKDAKLASAVSFDVPAGRVVHINEAGEFEMGIGATDMAIFLLNGSGDFDVSNPGTTASGKFMHQAIGPTGKMSGIVAVGGYEIESSEFDTTKDYVAGDLLTAAADNDDETVGGVLTNVVGSDPVEQYVDPVSGVCSNIKRVSEHGVDLLPFWGVYLPGAAS